MKPETLLKHYKSVKFVDCPDFGLKPIEKFPAMQGYLLIELIKRYRLPFKALGYNQNIVAIKTKKQCMLWRDTGIGATFLGIINLDDMKVSIKDDETQQTNKDTKPFNSFKELSAEIDKRKYNNIIGLRATITKADYWHFIEALPPLKQGKNWFILGEALTDEVYYKFIEYPSINAYVCEVVTVDYEEVAAIEAAY